MLSVELSQRRSLDADAEADIGMEDELSSATKLAQIKAPAPHIKTMKQPSLDIVRPC